MLGGPVRDRVPVYCGVYTAPDPPVCRDLTQELNERYGFTAFKLSPYRRDPYASRWGNVCAEAAGYFAEIRSISPPEWEFAFEAHARIFEPRQAIQLGNALAPYDPLWFEEPIRPEYIPAWGHLRAQLDVPLATGESLFLPQDFLALLTAGGADPYLPVDGYLELRPDRPGWGVEIDESALGTDDYVRWERVLPRRFHRIRVRSRRRRTSSAGALWGAIVAAAHSPGRCPTSPPW
ncbi:enolase C-terminal domain-like protein [Nonomuraea sp. H19]|uniref:enolase C-terminal domain-like protein n=1 Tax=Nonomuraea sp. H19 TaxID=3452206 RepID=UPI003F89F51B